jgi:hypothetical protein
MAHALETVTLFDAADGREVRLGRLWAERTAVLVFVRHFGCIFCHQQVAELEPFRASIGARGAELFVIGNGSVEEARAFRARQGTSFGILTDPSRQAYCAVGMRRSLLSVLTPGVFWRSLRAFVRGFRQTGVAGDPLQQGGVVVMAPGGRELYRFISREAGQHAPAAAIVESLRPAPMNG